MPVRIQGGSGGTFQRHPGRNFRFLPVMQAEVMREYFLGSIDNANARKRRSQNEKIFPVGISILNAGGKRRVFRQVSVRRIRVDARATEFRKAQRIAVVGVGAIGGTCAFAAAEAGHDVTLCVRRPFETLTLESQGEIRSARAHVCTAPDQVKPVDWLFIATKTQDTAKTKPWLDALIGRDTKVVLLQNGIDSVETAEPYIHGADAIPAIVYISAEKLAAGRIRHHFGNKVEVPAGLLADKLKSLLGENPWCAIFPREDFTNAIWRKYLCNLTLNPITALTLQRFPVMRNPSVRPLTLSLMREAAAVGRHMGMTLSDAEVCEIADFCTTLSPQGGTSMMYDREAGRPLEYEHLTGTVVRMADRFGVEVPVNRTILALISAIDAANRASHVVHGERNSGGVFDLKQGDGRLDVLNAG